MVKADFVAIVKEKGGYATNKEAEQAIKAFTEGATEVFKQRETITLIGFGTFSTVEVAEKSGKVPNNPDKTYTTPAHTAPKVKLSKALKEAIN